MDVKVADLPAWVGRRDKSIGAIYNEFIRNCWLVHYKYYSGPAYTPIVKTIFRVRFLFSLLFSSVKTRKNKKPLFSRLLQF